MRIVFTKHAQKKFADLRKLGVVVTKRRIRAITQNPTHIAEDEYQKKIAIGRLDAYHILRIVYKIKDDIITVITFYPARTGRYTS